MKIDREPLVNRFGRVAVDEATHKLVFKQLEYAGRGVQVGIGQVLQELIDTEPRKQGVDSPIVQVLKEFQNRVEAGNPDT